MQQEEDEGSTVTMVVLTVETYGQTRTKQNDIDLGNVETAAADNVGK